MKQRWLAEWTDEINRHCNINCINSFIHWGARDGAVVRAFASHQCGLGSNPGFDAICGLKLLLILSFAPRGLSPGTPVFPSLQKPAFPNSNSTRNQVDEEPLCGCATSKSLFILCYFILFVFMERIQTAFIASVAVSNCTVPKPLDLWSESKFISARTTLPEKHSSPSKYVGMLFTKDITAAGSCCSAVTKISSCQVNTTSRWGIKQFVIFSGSIFLLFSYGSSWGIYSWKPEEIPGPQP